MYFVVHLKSSSFDVIVPKQWLKGIDDHWQNFVNHSLNKNQVFLCYINSSAFDNDGCPRDDVMPQFTHMANPTTGFPIEEGCYEVYLVRYKSKLIPFSLCKDSIINVHLILKIIILKQVHLKEH